MANDAASAAVGGKTFLGHPRGLFVLFFAEMWERFSYYGMRALLIFYLTQHWLFADDASNIIYGAYTSLVYITPVLGGYLADRWLGQRKAVLFGAVLLTFGHFLMAFEGSGGQADPSINVFWLALALIIVGSGFLKANISVIVGQLYPRTDDHRDVRLEEAGADDDEGQGQPEDVEIGRALAAIPFERHQEVAEGQQHRAELHGLSLPQIAVRDIAAEHRGDVNERGIGAVDDRRGFVGEEPMLRQVEDQQRPHAVIGEALPHLGEEEDEEAAGVTKDRPTLFGGIGVGCHWLATPYSAPLAAGGA